VASFDRSIPPGGEGKITLSVNTKGYQGEHRWDARVNTNDPVTDLFHLEVRAVINVPVHVSPRSVYLDAVEGRTVTRGIEIRAGLDRPLTLNPERFDLEGKVSYDIQEVEKGKLFRILFTNLPSAPGRYQGALHIRTNYPERPDVIVYITVGTLGVKEKNPYGVGQQP